MFFNDTTVTIHSKVVKKRGHTSKPKQRFETRTYDIVSEDLSRVQGRQGRSLTTVLDILKII